MSHPESDKIDIRLTSLHSVQCVEPIVYSYTGNGVKGLA